MTKKVLSLLGLCCLFFLSSCMTYTYQDAKKIIPEEPQAAATEIIIPSTPTPEPEEKQDLRPIEVVLIPLPCNAEKTLLDTIIREADEGGYDLIGFTGETEALVYVASLVKTPVYWTQQGKVIPPCHIGKRTGIPCDSGRHPGDNRISSSPGRIRSKSLGINYCKGTSFERTGDSTHFSI